MLSKEVTITIYKVFGMTRPEIEPRPTGPLANILPTRPISQSGQRADQVEVNHKKHGENQIKLDIYIYIYIYICVCVCVCVYTAIWKHYMDSNKTAREKARRQLQKNAANNLEQVLAATPHKTSTVRPPASYHENYSS